MISYLDVNMEKFLWVPVDNDIFKKKKRKEKKKRKSFFCFVFGFFCFVLFFLRDLNITRCFKKQKHY